MLKKDKKLYLKVLKTNVIEENASKVRDIVSEFHIADIVSEAETWDIGLITNLIRLLSTKNAAKFIPFFSDEIQNQIISNFSKKELNELFESIDIDEAVEIIESLKEESKIKTLDSLNTKLYKKLFKQLKYEKNTVGFHMHHEYIYVESNWSIKKATSIIKQQISDHKREIAGDLFVVDKDKKLIGYILIEDLIGNTNNKKLINSLTKPIKSLQANSSLDSAINLIKKYDVPTVPVVDANTKLIGVLEANDIIDHLQEDIKHTPLIAPTKETKVQASNQFDETPYLEKSNKSMYKERIGWLLFLMFAGIITQISITGFQFLWGSLDLYGGYEQNFGALAWGTVVSLAFSSALSIVSSINDASGNSGAQTSSTLVRALALGQIKKDEYGKVYKKEMILSLRLATTLAIGSLIRTYIVWMLYTIPFRLENPQQHAFLFLVAAVGAFAFFIGVVVGNFFGVLLPIWAHKRGKDAAIISSPVQTTIADIFAIIFYLGITTAIFVPLGMMINQAHPASMSFAANNLLSLIPI